MAAAPAPAGSEPGVQTYRMEQSHACRSSPGCLRAGRTGVSGELLKFRGLGGEPQHLLVDAGRLGVGELFMMTRMRDRGSEKSHGSGSRHLSLPGPSTFSGPTGKGSNRGGVGGHTHPHTPTPRYFQRSYHLIA
ncbi:hypothetical protein TREES_T100004954 [Tupaia chinensis]|uniref:Uncharacterized protein n=1 Tax=Tupaia chinensis TaxID=246437 RepID=L9LDB5_TUPCH|nr:hypothetical protein TREES_T100004954 [Tupaia chinensis]